MKLNTALHNLFYRLILFLKLNVSSHNQFQLHNHLNSFTKQKHFFSHNCYVATNDSNQSSILLILPFQKTSEFHAEASNLLVPQSVQTHRGLLQIWLYLAGSQFHSIHHWYPETRQRFSYVSGTAWQTPVRHPL